MPSLNVIFDLTNGYLNAQIQSINSLRLRGTAHVGFSAAVFALSVAALQANPAKTEELVQTITFALIAALFLAITGLVFASFFQPIRLGPSPRTLLAEYVNLQARQTKLELLQYFYPDATRNNEDVLAFTTKMLDIATLLLWIQALLVGAVLAALRLL